MNPSLLPVAQSAPYRDALAQCVDHWGFQPSKTQLVRDGVNHVFATESKQGDPVIIRVSDGATRERGEIEGELLWLDHLKRHGCTVSTPVRSKNDQLLESIDLEAGTFHVSCFERFGGRLLDPKVDREWNDDLFLTLGRAVGKMHRISDAFELPADKNRKPWFESDLSRFPEPLPDTFDPDVCATMIAFTDEMRARPTLPRHYGLVHRDLHSGNFLFEDGEVELIDFDLGCYGWRAMDFAVLLFGHYFYPSHRVADASPARAGEVLATLVRGYRDEYEIDFEQLELIDDLLRLRSILNYIATAPAPQHWQVAMGDPHPTVSESVAWVEDLWRGNPELRVDLDKVQA
ncbi:MAG: phosphotransferase [Myxococcota bacterium]